MRQHRFRNIFDIFRHGGADGIVQANVTEAAAHAEDHARFALIERAGVERGVFERFFDRDQRKQLHGIDRLQGVRRNAVAHRIEGDIGQKSAPARVHLVARFFVGIEVTVGIEARLRNFGNSIYFADDVGPELANVFRFGHHAAHAHDGEIARRLSRPFRNWLQLGRNHVLQPLRAARRYRFVQFANRADFIAQGGDLPDHIHALTELLLTGHLGVAHVRAFAFAINAFRSDAQTADVERFERVFDLFVRLAFGLHFALHGAELIGERCVHAARGVPWTGFKNHGMAAVHGFLLERIDNRRRPSPLPW